MAKDKSKMGAVDAAVAHVAPGYADDMRWKAEDAMRDMARVEGHKKDKGLMTEVKKRVRGMAKSLGC